MGNITTHKNIALHIMRELRDASQGHVGAYRPEDEWFFEFGNWLTDMSQMRDPAAFISAKLTVWNKKTGISLTNAAVYLDRMMGQPKPNGQADRDYTGELNGRPPKRNETTDDGALTRWLRELVFAWGYETFVHRGKHLKEDEYKAIFDIFYTQYYPHEHLDCPTFPGGPSDEMRVIGERVGSLVARHACDEPPMEPKPKQRGGGGPSAADAWVRIRIEDEHGHPLSNVKLRFHPDGGASRDLTTDRNGMAEVTGLAAGTRFDLSCPISGQGEDEARLERSWSTQAISAAGHPIDATPTGPPGSGRKFILRVEAVKPTSSDSLKTLAGRANVSWEELARFNFGTDNPKKINDALRDRVGCHKFVNNNYRFAGDEKGVMYLPHLWEQSALGVNQTHRFRVTRADGRPVRVAQPKGGAKKGTTQGGGGTGSGSSSGSTRALLAYLDEQIQYLADLLTFIEFHWKALARETLSATDRAKRQRLLVLFGHACHAIEDFYFHSNFVEITWKQLKRELPKGRARNKAEEERHRRIFHRRLRAPRVRGNALDPDASDDGTRHLFTGFFGGTDVFHTVIDALDGLNEKLQLDDPKGFARRFPAAGPLMQGKSTADISKQLEEDAKNLGDAKVKARMQVREYEAIVVLWDTLGWVASENRRERLRKKDPTNKIGARHQARLLNGTYDRVFGTLQKHNLLHATSVDAIKRAFKIDRDLIFTPAGQKRSEWEKGVNLPDGILGTFAFLLTLAQTAEQEHHDSEEQSLEYDRDGLDGDDVTEAWNATNNEASAEVIGSHSLLAKDSPHKEPLRAPAVNIATRVSCFVARTMANQIVAHHVNVARFDQQASGQSQTGTFNTLNRGRCIDWLHLLQHFLCHPAECEHNWHVESMDMKPPSGTYKDHNTHYIIRRIDLATRDKRMKQDNRNRLDKEYHAFEDVNEQAWQDR